MKLKYIPNILSILRICLVALFVYCFFVFPDDLGISALIFIFSGITDIVDGRLARRFNWVSSLGKILDPLADKLMQCTALFCLAFKNYVPWWIFLFYVTKEILMCIGAILFFKRNHEIGVSKHFGKAAVVLFYSVVAAIILFGERIGRMGVDVMCVITAACAASALVLYYFNYIKTNKNKVKEPAEDGGEARIQ